MNKYIHIEGIDTEGNRSTMRLSLRDEPPPRKEIPDEEREDIVRELRRWLGPKGVEMFRTWKEDHGTVSPVLKDGPIPHPVHFREGMQVRNHLRSLTSHGWTDHEYDDNWQWLVEEAISLDEPFEQRPWWKVLLGLR